MSQALASRSGNIPRSEGLSARDRDRAASVADEGGVSAAQVEGGAPLRHESTPPTMQDAFSSAKRRAPVASRSEGSMLFELSVLPLGGNAHLSFELAQVLTVIDESGLPYRFGPSSTSIEGSWDAVMPVIRAAHQRARLLSPHVVTLIQVEDDGGQTDKLSSNVTAVEAEAGRDLATEGPAPHDPGASR